MMERYVHNWQQYCVTWGFPKGSAAKNLPANAADVGSVPVLGRFPGEENSNPRQYSCAWETPWTEEPSSPLHGVTKNQTQFSN